MISVSEIVQSFWEIVGWPYKTPGYNNENGIDCSGAFVRAYRQRGFSIYHGSNRIIRVYCHGVFRIDNASQLKPGMAVFKSRPPSGLLTAQYKPGGRYYNPALPCDFYHVGLVVSDSPMRIISATTPVARVDERLYNWTYAAYLNAVDYPGQSTPTTATVFAESGSTVNMRAQPALSARLIRRVPIGAVVEVLMQEAGGQWSRIRYEGDTGFMMSEFLSLDPGVARQAYCGS